MPQGPWRWSCASYATNGQVFQGNRWNTNYGRYPATIQDGTNNTIFFTEKEAVGAPCPGGRTANYNYWADWGPDVGDPGLSVWGVQGWLTQPQGIGVCYPVITPQPPGSACSAEPSTGHTGGIMVAMGDGSAHLVAQGISPATWWYAMTPQGGEVLGSDW